MYTVDEHDKVVPLPEFPQPSPSAPMPAVVSDEGTTLIAFVLHDDTDMDRLATVDVNGSVYYPDIPNDVVLVRFHPCHATLFGAPNDEAFSSHPLGARGLKTNSAFLVENSSWIRSLERMNSVNPTYSPDKFAAMRHFILSFHDSTFECVAETYECGIHRRSIAEVLGEALRQLGQNGKF